MDIHDSWKKVLENESKKDYFLTLMEKVHQAYKGNQKHIFPRESQLFRAFDLCPFDQLKVVILGQDPYPTVGHAHGLSFSVESDVYPFPKSLFNIFKEIQADLDIPMPSHGNLTSWAEQGVLLLNTILSVEEGKPESHKGFGWEKFTDAVIQNVNEKKEGIVFILWGARAIAKEVHINQGKHLILTSAHPSPLSAYRGFFGSKHFSKTNEFLRTRGQKEIRW